MTDAHLPDSVERFLLDHPGLQAVEVLIPDANGVLRGKRLAASAIGKIFSDGMRLPGSTYLLDIEGQNCLNLSYGSKDGDPDFAVLGDAATLMSMPWADRPSAQIIGGMVDDDGAPHFADPRSVLRRAGEPLKQMGLTPVVAVELEFYLLDGRLGRDGAPRLAAGPGLRRPPTGTQAYYMEDLADFAPVLHEIEATCAAQGIPADVTTVEYAPGQFEINLQHVADPLLACDLAVLFKRTVKAVARKHRMVASFMAKPFGEESGNGMHVHVSLVDGDGRNVFAGGPDAETGLPIADSLKHAIGGLRAAMPESMAIFAPNANSYRRFRLESYAPVNRAWGTNNRTVSLRIPHSGPAAVRVEHRPAGADANPYLTVAAILAGIHHGMENRVEPGPIELGNAYERPDSALPLRLGPSIDAFKAGGILPRYFGGDYHAALAGLREWEAEQHHNVIPKHDYDLYMRVV